jgi:hypothetical protein
MVFAPSAAFISREREAAYSFVIATMARRAVDCRDALLVSLSDLSVAVDEEAHVLAIFPRLDDHPFGRGLDVSDLRVPSLLDPGDEFLLT